MSRGIVKSRCVIIGKDKQIILNVGYVKVDNEHVTFNPTTFKMIGDLRSGAKGIQKSFWHFNLTINQLLVLVTLC